MGQITIFTRDGCPNCQAVRLDLKLCHLPYEEIVLEPTELQQAPLIYFDNQPIVGGVNELLDMLQDWEVVEGPDGKPTLEPMRHHQDPYHDHQHDYHHNHNHNRDPYQSQNNHQFSESYNGNGYGGSDQYHQNNSRNTMGRSNSTDSNYSTTYPENYSRGGNYRDPYREDHNHNHRGGGGDYGYRDDSYHRDENYRDDPYRDDYHHHHNRGHHNNDPYRDPHKNNNYDYHHQQQQYKDSYNQSHQGNTDPYSHHQNHLERERDHYNREPQPYGDSHHHQRDPYQRNNDDPYNNRDQYSHLPNSSHHQDTQNNYNRDHHHRNSHDDPYGRDSHHSSYSRNSSSHHRHHDDPYAAATDPQSQRDSYNNNNVAQQQQRNSHSRDPHSLSPYNLYQNSNRDDSSYADESHRGDPSYRDDSFHDESYRDDSYRDPTSYDDPYGLGQKQQPPNGKHHPYHRHHEQHQHQHQSSPRANGAHSPIPNRDARSIEAIQNRFHFRENRSVSGSTRDLYGGLSRQSSVASSLASSNHRQQPSQQGLSRQNSVSSSIASSNNNKNNSNKPPQQQQLPKKTAFPSLREQFRNKDSYDRHSFHGNSLQRQVLKKDKFQDDENPFLRNSGTSTGTTTTSSAATTATTPPDTPASRRDMFRKRAAYDRHSFHGKTLLQQHQNEEGSEDDEEDVPAPTTLAATNSDRFGSRREMFRKKASYDRHSFHGKTLQQQQREENNAADQKAMSQQQKGDSTHGSLHGSNSVKGSAHGSTHGSSSVKGSTHGGSRGGGSLHGGSVAGSVHSRRSIHVDLDKDSLADCDSDGTFSDEEDGEDDEHHSRHDNNDDGGSYFDDDDDDDDETKDYSYCSAKELDDALSRLSGSSKPRRGSKSSLSPEDLFMGGDESQSEHSVRSNVSVRSSLSVRSSISRSSDKRKPTKVFALGSEGGSKLDRFSRSFVRQSSSKSLTSKLSAGKASSMRYLSPNDTATSANSGLDSRARRRNTLTNPSRSVSPTPSSSSAKNSTSGMSSGLKAARSAALLKSSRRMSNNLNSSTNSQSSTSSMWSNSPGPALKDDKRCVELPIGNRMSILQAVQELKRIIPLGNLKYNLTTYRNSFTGTTLCDTFQERFRLSRRDAEDLGKSLGQAQVLHHVCGDHRFSDTEKLYFRLQCHQTPEILNSFCVWQDELSLTKNGADVMDEAMGRLLVVMDAITDSVKGRVHYSRATKQHEDLVAELDYAVCELQMVKLARFDKNALLAFGLNVYQLFLHYAFIKVGIPSSSSAFHSFWTNLKFNVGGDIYSFADWWNGICRGNRKGPHGPKPFQGKDPRCFLNLPEPLDARIHFAAGMTHFLRPMFVYSADNIHGELEHVARIYCKNVEFVWMETSTNTLTLAPNFQTYQTDFCSSSKNLPKAIMQWLPGKEKAHVDEMLTVQKKIKVEFQDNVKNDGWDEYAGEHFLYETAPRADFKKIITSKKKAAPERREVKRQGSLKSLFRLEGAAAS